MPKPNFPMNFTALQRQIIDRCAEIEQQDAKTCANCGGEDCACCEIYIDRQKWVSPEELFADDYDNPDMISYHDPRPEGCRGACALCDIDCAYREEDSIDPTSEVAIRRLEAQRECDEEAAYEEYCNGGHDGYPCDGPDHHCPFGADGTTRTYFCRDNCGFGVG